MQMHMGTHSHVHTHTHMHTDAHVLAQQPPHPLLKEVTLQTLDSSLLKLPLPASCLVLVAPWLLGGRPPLQPWLWSPECLLQVTSVPTSVPLLWSSP